MKNKLSVVHFLFVFFAMCLTFNSCEYQEPSAYRQSMENTWSLVKYTPSAFFSDNFETFEEGQVLWSFDDATQNLEVKLEGIDKIENLPAPGTYKYEFKEHPCNYDENEFISIEGREYGVMIADHIVNDTLIISHACLDGHIILFVK